MTSSNNAALYLPQSGGNINLSQRVGFGPESLVTMTGSWVAFTALAYNPVVIIFDNQSSVSVQLSLNSTGSPVWKTFQAGEAFVLDLRANHGMAPNYTIDAGTIFYGNGASGNFSISYVYAVGV